MSIVNVETMATAPEGKDAPEDRPLSNVLPKSQDKYCDAQPQRPSGRRLHDANLRFRHLFQKAGAVAEHLYMNCDMGIVALVGMVGIFVVICIALYHLCEATIYALRDHDMVY